MQEILPAVDEWRKAHKAVALATVIATWGSAPRGVGAKMAVTAGAEMAGSVSGGCVEGAVVESAVEVLGNGEPRLLRFGVADETAWEVGLACGGRIEVFVRPLARSQLDAARVEMEAGRPAALVTVIDGPPALVGSEMLIREDGSHSGTLSADLEPAALDLSRGALAQERSQQAKLETAQGETVELFIETILPPPSLIIVGGVHIATTLVTLANALGYRTVVVDPRRAFGSQARFAHADKLIQAWPDAAFNEVPLNRRTAVAMLTHDPKIDDPALKLALPSPAFYVGALGSRQTNARRRERLLAAGLPAEQLDRLHAPIGLDLGGRTPEEIALAVMAEVVQAWHARQVAGA